MDLKKFFNSIAHLPLEDKIAKVFETFVSKNELKLANQTVLKLIGRDKTISLQEKERLILKYFPENASNLFLEIIEASRKKPHNLTNQLHLLDYIKLNMNQGGLLHTVHLDTIYGLKEENVKEKNKRFLKTIAAFLTQKRELNEYVDKHDCQIIKNFLKVELYTQYQDQINDIIHVAFRFKKQRIKQYASAFYDEVISHTGNIDKVLFLLLLRGAYLSEEVYNLLIKHADLITDDESLGNDVIEAVQKLQTEDLNASKEERQMIDHALEILNAKMVMKAATR